MSERIKAMRRSSQPTGKPLKADLLRKLDARWPAANYPSYILDREPKGISSAISIEGKPKTIARQ
jgi:hypothetical protein